MMTHKGEVLKAARLAFTAVLLLTVAASGASCKRSRVENTGNANAAGNAGDVAQRPPFQTREPERYQWTRVITAVTSVHTASTGEPSVTQTVFMARDGDKRREDYEMPQGVKMTVLRLPEGSYTIYPSKKMYAEIGADSSQEGAPSATPDFSADKLVNASRVGARYEKLGTEEVLGRTTTKYRVTAEGSGAGAVSVETILWVDESLGMPVRSESTSRSEAMGESRYTVEYRDIKLEADDSLFVLPKDYRKVTQAEIQRETLQSMPGVMGGDNEENKERSKKR